MRMTNHMRAGAVTLGPNAEVQQKEGKEGRIEGKKLELTKEG